MVPLEVKLLRRAGRVSGVLNLLDVFCTPDYYIVVMERPETSIDLFDYITQNGPLPETEARRMFIQVFI